MLYFNNTILELFCLENNWTANFQIKLSSMYKTVKKYEAGYQYGRITKIQLHILETFKKIKVISHEQKALVTMELSSYRSTQVVLP